MNYVLNSAYKAMIQCDSSKILCCSPIQLELMSLEFFEECRLMVLICNLECPDAMRSFGLLTVAE